MGLESSPRNSTTDPVLPNLAVALVLGGWLLQFAHRLGAPVGIEIFDVQIFEALALTACCLALGFHRIGAPDNKSTCWAVRALCFLAMTIGVATADKGILWWTPPDQAGILGQGYLPAFFWHIGHLLLLGTTSAAIYSLVCGWAPLRRWMMACAAIACACCASFLFFDVFALVTGTKTLGPLVLDLLMAQYLALNLWTLEETPEGARVMGLVTAHDVGARVGRRLLFRGAFMLLILGAMRVALQRQEWMAIGQRTALTACALFTYLMVAAYQHASTLRAEIQARRIIEADLADAIATRDAALKQVHQERNLLDGVLLGASQYAIIATDTDGIITLFNEGAEKMLGYRAEEALGQPASRLLHDPDEISQRSKILGTSTAFDLFRLLPNLDLRDNREWTYVRKDGSKLPVSLSVTRLADEYGTTEGYVGIARDLTQDKQNQRDRDGFLAVGQELLCIIDTQGKLHMVNPAFTRMLGYASQELLGASIFDFVHPDDVEATRGAVEDIVDGVKLRRFENRWRAKDGRYHWISWDCTCLTEDGVYYASGWDVSAEKRQARQRERHLEFEQQLIGIVSHDLRNPIAAIALTAEALMRKKDVAATLERPLQRITHSAKRAERMIFDLLDFTQARLGTGLIMHRSRVDIGEVAGRCLDDLQVVHPSRQLKLVVNDDPVIDADGDRLAQVITNLAGNGLKYSPHDAPVTVTLTHTPDAFTLKVHNEGDPINPSELPYIFKPLRRGSRLGQTERNIGLGLYIVKEIVKAHGGTIAVTSDLLHGTTFKVCLPQSVPSGKALPRPSAARV